MGKYREWLSSDAAKKRVLDSIKKSGMPLELVARKILTNNNFTVTNARYLEPDPDNSVEINMLTQKGVWREIDLLATRLENKFFSVEGCEVHFKTCLLGECKYLSDRDILAFEHATIENVDLKHYPLFVNGQDFLPDLPKEHFSLPMVSERLIEIDIENASKEKGNLSDRTIHDASEQLLSALTYNINESRQQTRHQYLAMSKLSSIQKNWDEVIKNGNVPHEEIIGGSRIPKSFINKFAREQISKFNKPNALQDFPVIQIVLFFPVIIFDESTGIVQVKMHENYEMTELKEVGACLYTYVSENLERYSIVLDNAFILPILVCNTTNLESLIGIVNKDIDSIIDKMKEKLIAEPHLIVEEVFFSR